MRTVKGRKRNGNIKRGDEMKIVKSVLWWIWLLFDTDKCLRETTTQKERETMGVYLER